MDEASPGPTSIGVALVAGSLGRDVAERFHRRGNLPGSSVAILALARRTLEHSTDMAGLTINPAMRSGEREARLEMIELELLAFVLSGLGDRAKG
jgi:hypothetical protein